jgi:hypothetical protein
LGRRSASPQDATLSIYDLTGTQSARITGGNGGRAMKILVIEEDVETAEYLQQGPFPTRCGNKSCRFFPRLMFAVGVWYLGAGLCGLRVCGGSHTFSPWAMGLPFGIGQLAGAGVLRFGFDDKA